jgi:hypothetical protein
MRQLLFALLLGLLASSACAQVRDTMASDSARYGEIVRRLQAGDTLVDYTTLRFLFVKQPHPGDRHLDPGAELRAAEQAPDRIQARRLIDALLADYYGLLQAHLDAARVFTARGDTDRARFHEAVVRGMVRSMEAAGRERRDGAMPVISIFEEYAFLRARGLEPRGQALVECGKDRCDVLTALDPKTNQTKRYTFLLTWYRDEGEGKP